ncbi:hypothetical protein V6O07_15910, partial [Arthrospira platensis SPKY2]
MRPWAYDAGMLLALAIGCFAVGNLAAAKRDFLTALFRWPPLRLVVLNCRDNPELWREGRGVVPCRD